MENIRWHGSNKLPSQQFPQDQRQPVTRKTHVENLIAFLRRQGHHVKGKRNREETGAKAASNAGKTLRDPKSSKAARSAAG